MGKISTFGCWLGFSPIPRVFHKGSGERGTVHTWWVQQFFDIFVKKGDTWHVILGDNPAGHYFVLKHLFLIELFQISHSCVTECMLHAKFLLKVLKAKSNRDTFFTIIWDFQHVKFLSNRRGKTFRLAGKPPLPLLNGTSWSPHEENPEGGWSAYCNDFLSKQKNHSMYSQRWKRGGNFQITIFKQPFQISHDY